MSSWDPGFKSQAQDLCFFDLYRWKSYYICYRIWKEQKYTKETGIGPLKIALIPNKRIINFIICRAKAEVHNQASSRTSDSRQEAELDLSQPIPVLNFFGYAFCPGNCVFGPWVKYTDYVDIFNNPRWVKLLKFVLALIWALFDHFWPSTHHLNYLIAIIKILHQHLEIINRIWKCSRSWGHVLRLCRHLQHG